MEGNDQIKEAIALAKAVKQTALANAKVALEEAFSERYHAMFAQKLKEDAGMEEARPAEEEEGMKTADEKVSTQEIDELIKELEAEVAGENPAEEPGTDDTAVGAVPPVPPAQAGAMPPVPPVGGEIPPVAPSLVPPTVPGAMCVPAPIGGAMPPVPPVPPAPVGGEIPPASTTPPSEVPPAPGDEEDENIDLNELLRSLKEEVEEEGYEEEEEESKKLDEDKKLSTSGIGGSKAGGSDNKKPSSSASSSSQIESGGLKQEGMPSPDNTKTGPSDATKASRPNKGSHATKDNLSTPAMGGGDGSGGNKETGTPSPDNTKTGPSDATKAARPNKGPNATKDNLSTPGGMLQEENESLKKQLSDKTECITYMKGQLNEVNLLNAKLLYTNKLFKEYSMNNDHKMKIVEMFDLAQTVREVKLTYANIAESLNFSGVDTKKKIANTSVQSITEGLASRAVGSTKPKEIITEGKFAARMKQLAGIRSVVKK